jgi:O-antigen ligase
MLAKHLHHPIYLALWLGLVAAIGTAIGFLVGVRPLLLAGAFVAVVIVTVFFRYFEYTVLGLLILRMSLDLFSRQGVPALFAIGLDGLILLYVTYKLLTGQRVQTDRFWWFFTGWLALQGLWVVLLPLGGLGLDAAQIPTSFREWVRIASWGMVYLLVTQLRGKLHPEKIASALFLSLVVPLTVALLQVLIPPSVLPTWLVFKGDAADELTFEAGSRIAGTLGHPNGFAKVLVLFIALTWWKLNQSKGRSLWLLLLGVLIFFLTTTKALFSVGMFGVFIVAFGAQRLNFPKFIGGILVFVVFVALFANTEFGQERLSSIANTPLLNPNIDASRAIVLSEGNSFNWRIAQWTYLLQAWRHYPWLGYGLQSSAVLTVFSNYAHNDYVRVLAEEGIVGLIVFLILWGVQLIRLLNVMRSPSTVNSQRGLCAVLIALWLAILLAMSSDNVWSNTVFFFYWWTLLAVVGWDWRTPCLESTTSTQSTKYPLNS